MPPKRTPSMAVKLAEAARLVQSGTPYAEAAAQVGVGTTTLWRYVTEEGGDSYALLERECRTILQRAYKSVQDRGLVGAKFPCRLIFLDDLHIPFTDFRVIREVLEREGEADILVTFEVINFDSFSRFDQEYLGDPGLEEILALAVLSNLRNAFKRVVCGTSNHMTRPQKSIMRGFRPEQQEYIRDRLTSVFDALRELRIEHVNSSILQVGDSVFGHYDRTLSTPGKTAERLRERCRAMHDIVGVSKHPAGVFTGHTHRVSQTPSGSDYNFEVGCATYAPPYSLEHGKSGALAGFRMAVGYGVAEFDRDGRINYAHSRSVPLGWARLPEEVR